MTSTAPRAVFVASLSHSGSTVLDLTLGGHSRVVGLGEVRSLLTVDYGPGWEREVCSCGARLRECEFWGSALAALDGAQPPSLEEGYRTVLASFRHAFGDDRILVDSSKRMEALSALASSGADVTVVHLIRDVRSWTVSMRDVAMRQEQQPWRERLGESGVGGLLRPLNQSAASYFRLWYRRNREIASKVTGLGLPYVRVGYEELATAPGPVLERLCAQLGLEMEDTMLVPACSRGHTVFGNAMRHSPERLGAVMYDLRWLTRRDWVLPAVLFRRVMRYNAEEVYSNREHLPWR